VLHRLERTDGLTELDPRAGVLRSGVEHRRREADQLVRDGAPTRRFDALVASALDGERRGRFPYGRRGRGPDRAARPVESSASTTTRKRVCRSASSATRSAASWNASVRPAPSLSCGDGVPAPGDERCAPERIESGVGVPAERLDATSSSARSGAMFPAEHSGGCRRFGEQEVAIHFDERIGAVALAVEHTGQVRAVDPASPGQPGQRRQPLGSLSTVGEDRPLDLDRPCRSAAAAGSADATERCGVVVELERTVKRHHEAVDQPRPDRAAPCRPDLGPGASCAARRWIGSRETRIGSTARHPRGRRGRRIGVLRHQPVECSSNIDWRWNGTSCAPLRRYIAIPSRRSRSRCGDRRGPRRRRG
jgi:hypothetical protein